MECAGSSSAVGNNLRVSPVSTCGQHTRSACRPEFVMLHSRKAVLSLRPLDVEILEAPPSLLRLAGSIRQAESTRAAILLKAEELDASRQTLLGGHVPVRY